MLIKMALLPYAVIPFLKLSIYFIAFFQTNSNLIILIDPCLVTKKSTKSSSFMLNFSLTSFGMVILSPFNTLLCQIFLSPIMKIII